jgi:hypothetical protein
MLPILGLGAGMSSATKTGESAPGSSLPLVAWIFRSLAFCDSLFYEFPSRFSEFNFSRQFFLGQILPNA